MSAGSILIGLAFLFPITLRVLIEAQERLTPAVERVPDQSNETIEDQRYAVID